MEGKPARLKILIADDHEVVLRGIAGMLAQVDEFDVCGEATDGREALHLAEKLQPDVALLDISMPELNGIDATRQIRRVAPKTRVIIFTMHDAERLVHEVFQAGAFGYVLKSDVGTHLLAAIRTVGEGRHYFSSKVSEMVFEGYLRGGGAEGSARTDHPEETRLTTRERETVQLLAEGKSNKEVAATLGISVKTAETHRAAIMRKLGLGSVSDLVRYAIRNRIIEA
ncbi:MAG: response regulator transcription factor [Chthoniobacterales bacterium]